MSPSPWQLLIVLAIILLIFGTKKLRNMGSDLGGAVKGFKQGVAKDEDDPASAQLKEDGSGDKAGDPKDKA